MAERLPQQFKRAAVLTLRAARQASAWLAPALAAAWRVARPVLRRALEFLLALIIVFEEWGWRPLADLLGRLARWRPWAAIESVIIRLPPYAALFVFALPSALLLPLKFLALFLIASGQLVLASLLFVAAKVVATALVARLFMLTQPALMQIGWFAWAYDTVMPWKEALVDRVHASWAWRAGRIWKERARRLITGQWQRIRPTMLELREATRAAGNRLRARSLQLARAIRARWAASRPMR
jgi:hypothetical protein